MRRAIVLAFVAFAGALFGGEAEAAPWCGTVSDVDRAAVRAGYPIRVLYATAVEGEDRASEVAPGIAADVAEIDSWWRREDSSRTPRFDVAAFPCGSQPDILRLRVPRSSGELIDPWLAYSAIWDTLSTWPTPERTKYLVYYDGPTEGRACGLGGGNPHGLGLAVVFSRACVGVGSAWTAAHELLHAFGAVPHVGPSGNCPNDPGHVCDSSGDILYQRAQYAPLSSSQLDVGRNDYYGHSGSWLDVQKSLWLHRLDTSIPLETELRGSGSVTSDVPGIDCSASCRTDWSPGTRVSLTAAPAAGGKFVAWEGDCGGSGVCVLDLDAVKKVTAVFAPERYGVAVSVAGRGRVTSAPRGLACPGRCSAQFPSYEYIVLKAMPAKGWRLKGWSGACRGRRPTCELALTRAAGARATFVRVRKF